MMIVIGAGMAGLLAGAMLRNDCSRVVEGQPSLPNNHSAVLRFRSTVVADTLNIPFKKVRVMKAVQPWRNPIADAMAYSFKNTGTSSLRSIISAQGEIEDRYISPPNLIRRMASCVTAPISYGQMIDSIGQFKGQPVISTMPMHVLMRLLDWETDQQFQFVSGVNVTARVEHMDAYFSLYVPDPNYAGSRISMTGDHMVVECPKADPGDKHMGAFAEETVAKAASAIGINVRGLRDVAVHHQRYAKILPIDDEHRKRFILWASEHHNVYSLGRFATWRPGLLLDDVVNDVRVICRLIAGNSAYDAKKGG